MEKQTGRLEAFSDGIFSVAITLLALEIGIKEYAGATNLSLWHKILDDWPKYFTYFNSFATLLLLWMGHHRVLRLLRAANHWIILANGLVLLFVVLFPFPTKTVGEFIGTGAEQASVAFYAGFTACLTATMLLLHACIYKNKRLLLQPHATAPLLLKMMKGQAVAITIYTGITIVAFWSPAAALAGTFGMWVFWMLFTRDREEEA